MGVHVDPVGQGSPLRVQVDRGGGMLEAAATARHERMNRPKDCILAPEDVQDMKTRLYGLMISSG